MKEIILMVHPTFGVLGVLAAVWVFVDTFNASPGAQRRIHTASLVVASFMWLSFLAGGYWYVTYYGADRDIIKAGPWPLAHGFVMETKEHVFFTLLLLATYLPFVTSQKDFANDSGARRLVLVSAALVVLLGLAMEGAGAVVALGVKMGLLGR